MPLFPYETVVIGRKPPTELAHALTEKEGWAAIGLAVVSCTVIAIESDTPAILAAPVILVLLMVGSEFLHKS